MLQKLRYNQQKKYGMRDYYKGLIIHVQFDYCEPHTCDLNHELGEQNSQRIQKYVRRDRQRAIQYCLNCWKTLKISELQRKHEIELSVNVAKAEKIRYIA